MSKPIVFFSHSPKDGAFLNSLKDLFVQKTGGTVEVFLSSDGQSIPLGRNWVHKLEQALTDSKIMFVFISPNSLHSQWIYFEAGYAYSKNMGVIPIGILGVDLTQLPPPLGLLQGFNITSADSLNNFVAVINKEFGYSFPEIFTEEEYKTISQSFKDLSDSTLGKFANLIDTIVIKLPYNFPLSVISHHLEESSLEYQEIKNILYTHGVSFFSDGTKEIVITVDPVLTGVTFPILTTLIKKVRDEHFNEFSYEIKFIRPVYKLNELYKINSKIYRSEIKIGENSSFRFREISFNLIHYDSLNLRTLGVKPASRGTTGMKVKYEGDSLEKAPLAELLQLLFDLGILFTEAI